MYETILVEHQGPVALVTLNRPRHLNAYTVRMGEELVKAFRALRDDDSVRVVVLTGAGRGFCAGVDLKALQADAAPDPDLPALGDEHFVRGFAVELYQFPKPVIAAINGAAVGVGVTMTLPCDIRIAVAGAKLALPFAKLGIVPGLGSTYLLPRLVGPGNAKILALSGSTILAEEAQMMGLVDRVVAEEALAEEALALANAIAGNPVQVVSLIKEALNVGTAGGSLADALAFEHAQNARRKPIDRT